MISMERKPILIHPDARLRLKSEKHEFSDWTIPFVEELLQRGEDEGWLGLAAPQLGILERIFVCRIGEEYKEFINPEIEVVDENDVWAYPEGCLSIPKYFEGVTRPRTISIEYQDRNGDSFHEVYSDIESREILHEYDHLDGILFIDHLNRKQRRKFEAVYRRK
jgi:peptide deformylase